MLPIPIPLSNRPKASMYTITATANEKSEQMLPVKRENFILKEYLLNNASSSESIWIYAYTMHGATAAATTNERHDLKNWNETKWNESNSNAFAYVQIENT